MSIYGVIQLSTLAGFLILFAFVMFQSKGKLKDIFLLYLAAAIVWSVSSCMAYTDLSWGRTSFWVRFIPFLEMWVLVAYSHFITTIVGKSSRSKLLLGYGFLFVVAIFAGLGYLQGSIADISRVDIYSGYLPWIYFLVVSTVCFMAGVAFFLIKSYRTSSNPEHRNRVIYLLAGVGLLAVFGLLYEVLPRQEYAFWHIGHLVNAALITYAVLRYRLPDVKLIMRRGVAYSVVTICITATYLIVLTGFSYTLQSWSSSVRLGAIAVMAVLMACLFNPLRSAAQRVADRLFYGKGYDSREMVSTFAHRMSSVLDLDELAEAMLKPIVKAVHARQVSLLLPADQGFSSQFVERLEEGETVSQIKLRQDSPIVTWLETEGKLLSRDEIEVKPEFKELEEAERKAIDDAEIELFCPMKIKGDLIGILALSKKQPRGLYGNDDINMLTTLANEGAVVVENARLYAEARQRADTDELTGLFNHRFFQERLDKEIARCSRFGEIFSLLFMDLDLFKTYNDVYGHLSGDEMLRRLSDHIKSSIRCTDTAFRYGGDEFAIILPQTSLDNAYTVADRIRRGIGFYEDVDGAPLTCSIGIALWPTDGVMREEITHASDMALYQAKQNGRNRICLASEVASSKILNAEAESESRTAITSTIYALAATVDAKDSNTYGHSKKVSKHAVEIAKALGYSKERMDAIRVAGLLHDIGKIGISDQLLQKRGSLSTEDWELIRAHPNLGVAILKNVDSLQGCLAGVQYHHEHYDGTGYPSGLKGENIPLDARILTVADAYDAMTSMRPYRSTKMTSEQAMEELRRCAGTHFDPKIVEAFIGICKGPKSQEIEAKPGVVSGLGQGQGQGQ